MDYLPQLANDQQESDEAGKFDSLFIQCKHSAKQQLHNFLSLGK